MGVAQELTSISDRVLRSDFVQPFTDGAEMDARASAALDLAHKTLPDAEMIDATDIWEGVAKRKGVQVETQVIAPPFETFVIGFAIGPDRRCLVPFQSRRYDADEIVAAEDRWEPFLEDVDVIDWQRVRWVISGAFWLANFEPGSKGVVGPIVWLDFAAYDDGQIADGRWLFTASDPSFNPLPPEEPAMAHVPFAVSVETLNFLNATNTYLDQPHRPRPERRALERQGRRVTTVHVRPAGSRPGTPGRPIGEVLGRGQGPVRGHFAEYGPKYGKGLLFGRHEGRFYISPHVRGTSQEGTIKHESYKLDPD